MSLDPVLAAAATLVLAFLARRWKVNPLWAPTRWLQSAAAPAVLGVLTALAVLGVWGSFHAQPIFHDESAYLLQAEIFAKGQWTLPARPLPEFFEQMHVFVTPMLAARYPPGHSLHLVPGVALALPGLVPLLESAFAGALVFSLARRLSNPWTALLCWGIWLSASGNLRFRASYFSEVTTSLLWLVGWWALLEWRSSNRRRWIVFLAVVIGIGILTRPMTMAAYALPAGLLILRDVSRSHRWRDVAVAFAVGASVLAIHPIWSLKTCGDWRTNPYWHHSRVYFPYNWVGFGINPMTPLRPLPPAMKSIDRVLRITYRWHTPASLPRTLVRRLKGIGKDLWSGWRFVFFPLFLVGILRLPRQAAFGLAAVALLIVGYLALAYPPDWTLYYLEIHPPIAFVSALGLWTVLGWLRGPRSRAQPTPLTDYRPVAALLLFLALLPPTWEAVERAARWRQDWIFPRRRFEEALAGIYDSKAVVFVRYAPDRNIFVDLVENSADLENRRVWLVHDLGPENRRLLAFAPDRTAYLYDQARNVLVRLAPTARDRR